VKSETGREGSYPPPPFWPDKLCFADAPLAPHPLSSFHESDAVQHDYVADGWPGPCAISFRDGKFINWRPALTVERAEKYARTA
jgi:hypothetical protein